MKVVSWLKTMNRFLLLPKRRNFKEMCQGMFQCDQLGDDYHHDSIKLYFPATLFQQNSQSRKCSPHRLFAAPLLSRRGADNTKSLTHNPLKSTSTIATAPPFPPKLQPQPQFSINHFPHPPRLNLINPPTNLHRTRHQLTLP